MYKFLCVVFFLCFFLGGTAMVRPGFVLDSLRTPRVFTMCGRRSDDAGILFLGFVAYASRVHDARSPQR